MYPGRLTCRTLATVAFLVAVLLPPSLVAAPARDKERLTTPAEKFRKNLDYRVELAAALKGLARETATNLIVDGRVAKEAQTPVTLQAEDVPWRPRCGC